MQSTSDRTAHPDRATDPDRAADPDRIAAGGNAADSADAVDAPDSADAVDAPGPADAAGAADERRCSARGCREPATVDLHWRNPRLHDTARVKHWLACDDHEAFLADFLDRRGFLLTRDPL